MAPGQIPGVLRISRDVVDSGKLPRGKREEEKRRRDQAPIKTPGIAADKPFLNAMTSDTINEHTQETAQAKQAKGRYRRKDA
jgi:hypothetical protein